MSTLLMRLAAPMQSWGIESKFEKRSTERLPTKSGVIGLVAGALGKLRTDNVDDLCQLRFGVRIDCEGVLINDYHTAKSKKDSYVTNRHYLSDAVFLVGLEGEDDYLNTLAHALCKPVFPLFLGRRSCPPEGQILLGVRKDKSLLDALKEEPWLVNDQTRRKKQPEVKLRIVIDGSDQHQMTHFCRDVPISFNQNHRKYGFRGIHEAGYCSIQNTDSRYYIDENSTEHDPMSELREE